MRLGRLAHENLSSGRNRKWIRALVIKSYHAYVIVCLAEQMFEVFITRLITFSFMFFVLLPMPMLNVGTRLAFIGVQRAVHMSAVINTIYAPY